MIYFVKFIKPLAINIDYKYWVLIDGREIL
jgi:hypothetical protein